MDKRLRSCHFGLSFYLVFSNDDSLSRFPHQLAAYLPVSGILHPMLWTLR